MFRVRPSRWRPRQSPPNAAISGLADMASDVTVEELMKRGFSEVEAKAIVAAAKSPKSVVDYTREKIDEKAVETLMSTLGISRVEAEALIATGANPSSLKSMGKSQALSLYKSIEARLSKEGINLSTYAAKGLGIPEGTFNTAARGAQAAYQIFSAITSAAEVFNSSSYVASRWSEDFKGEASLMSLGRALDEMGAQGEMIRKRREQTYTTTNLTIAGAAAAGGPIGVAVGAAYFAITEGIKALGWVDTSDGDNSASWAANAKGWAERLWQSWRMVPPAFDARFYTLKNYSDICELQVHLLEKTYDSATWRAEWVNLMDWAIFQPVTGGKLPHPAATDLVLLGWMPFPFSEWMGGTVSVSGTDWHVGSTISNLGWATSDSKAPSYAIVGGPGSVAYGGGNAFWPGILRHRTMPQEYVARAEQFGYPGDYPEHEKRGSGPASIPPSAPWAPRDAVLQTIICDRIAGAIGTLLAARAGVAVEPTVEAAVAMSRLRIKDFGWQPIYAAERFKDVFQAAKGAVAATTPIVARMETMGSKIDILSRSLR